MTPFARAQAGIPIVSTVGKAPLTTGSWAHILEHLGLAPLPAMWGCERWRYEHSDRSSLMVGRLLRPGRVQTRMVA